MKPISEVELQNSLTSGSKRRLRGQMKSLSQDREKVIFDDKGVDVLLRYAWEPDHIKCVLNYLETCKDDKGHRFSQSLREASKLREQVIAFQKPNHTSFRWNRNYQKSVKVLKDEFSSLHLKPISYGSDDDIREILPKADTHAGWSYIETGRRKKGEYIEGSLAKYREEETKAKEVGSFNKPILPGTRTQCSGAFNEADGSFTGRCKHKTRLVAMVDIWQILAELQYAKPIQNYMASVEWYAGGKSNSDIRLITMYHRRDFMYWMTLDYSQFDASISNWLIEDAFDILKTAFDYVDESLWEVVVRDFISKNYILWDGVYHCEKGVPSGSMFTQIIDSIVNRLMILTYAESKGLKVSMIIMGDDNLLSSEVCIDSEDIASYISKNFGVSVNASKTTQGRKDQYPEFLSRVWRPDGEWRHPNVLISKLAYPERFRDYSKDVEPAEVLFGYICAYNVGMQGLIDVGLFMREHLNYSDEVLAKVDHRYIPGSLAYIREYTMG